MNIALPKLMTIDEFVVWTQSQPNGRYELIDGKPVRLPAGRVSHVKTKSQVWLALREACRTARIPSHALIDGPGVKISEGTAYEPDALVYCGAEVPDDTIFIEAPVIVVEVLSPSNRAHDAVTKLKGYFKVPSIQHYLIVDTDDRSVLHHRRTDRGVIETQVLFAGSLLLEPPGLTLHLIDIFAPA